MFTLGGDVPLRGSGHVARKTDFRLAWQPRPYGHDEAPYALDHSAWGNAADN
jgi:hypothetical protein